jgi:hypothetical protein
MSSTYRVCPVTLPCESKRSALPPIVLLSVEYSPAIGLVWVIVCSLAGMFCNANRGFSHIRQFAGNQQNHSKEWYFCQVETGFHPCKEEGKSFSALFD